MRVTIIQKDGLVGINGDFRKVDLSDLDTAIHAVQFDTAKGKGHIEYDADLSPRRENKPITEFGDYSVYINRWSALTPPPPTLEQIKQRAHAKLNQERDSAITEGVQFAGNVFDADDRSRTNLIGVVAAIQAGIPLPDGFAWRSKDNKDIPKTQADLVGLAAAMLQHVNGAYQKSWSLKATADAATTKEAVEAVKWAA
jgi:hypothetical protein